MNPSADVRSLEALLDWYTALCEFAAEAQNALAAIALDVQRASGWLEAQEDRWQGEVRRAEEEVVRAKAELRNRRQPDFSGRVPDCSVQEKALRRAEARLEHARRQVKVTRQWLARLPALVGEVYDGPARRLGGFLEGDLPRALAALGRQLEALERYAQIRPDHIPAGLRPPPGAKGGGT
ncbi:MAG TPA: hypothetical protein VIL46_16480 [Gemmataceae bacterium]